MLGGVCVWCLCMCVSLQEVRGGYTFKYEFTLWAYFSIVGVPHIESHSNACLWPKNPLRVTPYLPPLIICIKKIVSFLGLKNALRL